MPAFLDIAAVHLALIKVTMSVIRWGWTKPILHFLGLAVPLTSRIAVFAEESRVFRNPEH
jgi:hypothetical protein